jgi:PKD repeat protein
VVNPVYISYKWYDSSQTYLQDGTKMNMANLTSDKKYVLKALNSEGCFSDPAEISLNVDNVHAGFTHDISTVALGNAVKFTSTSINASSVAWNFFEGDIIHETNPVHYYNTLGGTNSKKFDVKLNVISPGGCLDSLLLSDVITVFNDITSIETSKSVTFSYYPNPVSEKLYLTSSESIRTVKVFTINGNLIESLAFNEESVSIDFSELKSGIYFLEVNGAQETKKNIKIIRQ